VSYVADISGQCNSDGVCSIKIPRPNQDAARLDVSVRDEVYSSAPYGGRLMSGEGRQLVIWRYERAGATRTADPR
jgi:hypothetical protein